MRILITGGTGFIGSALVKKLLYLKHDVIITGIDGEQPIPNDVICHDYESLYGLKVDAIFHQAAINDTQTNDTKSMWHANFELPIKIFKDLYENGCRKFIYASSAATYGQSKPPFNDDFLNSQPLTAYSRTKAAFDLWAQDFAPDASVIGMKYSNVYGPGEAHKGKRMSMVGQILHTMLKSESPKLFAPGDQKRDWVYIDDVVHANLLAFTTNIRGVFNVGSGDVVMFKDLVKIINEQLETQIPYTLIENPYANTYQDVTELTMKKARTLLGYVPHYSVKKGISEYVKHLKITHHPILHQNQSFSYKCQPTLQIDQR